MLSSISGSKINPTRTQQAAGDKAIPPKLRSIYELHGAVSNKMATFINILQFCIRKEHLRKTLPAVVYFLSIHPLRATGINDGFLVEK
jgi:hypothetical protein